MNNDPRNTADDLASDKRERMTYDPHNEWAANRALAASVDRRIAFDTGADITDGASDDEK